MEKNKWTPIHTIGLLLMLGFIVVFAVQTVNIEISKVGSRSSPGAQSAPWTWYAVLVLLTVFIVVAGQGIVGRWLGFLIDARNKMTLSRLQLVLWTVVVLSAYLTAALARVKSAGIQALDISMPPELWWLMGISTASMVGSPLILSNKKTRHTNAEEEKAAVARLAAQDGIEEDKAKSSKSAVGSVMTNTSAAEARIADLFRGDETGNAAHLDLGKVQMFFFTVVLVLAYFFTLKAGFPDIVTGVKENGEMVYRFPALSQSMVTLLGISHAGYLADKVAPHSQTA